MNFADIFYFCILCIFLFSFFISFLVLQYASYVSCAPKYDIIEIHPSRNACSVLRHSAVPIAHVPVMAHIPFRVYEMYFILLTFFDS